MNESELGLKNFRDILIICGCLCAACILAGYFLHPVFLMPLLVLVPSFANNLWLSWRQWKYSEPAHWEIGD